MGIVYIYKGRLGEDNKISYSNNTLFPIPRLPIYAGIELMEGHESHESLRQRGLPLKRERVGEGKRESAAF
jgi:hypothetical protein